jgi:diguanylate cyclase (GGDEF)-like protein
MATDIRPYDAVGRYGGEEFLVLLPGCNDSETRAKAERLREAISGELIGTAGGNLKVTMSVGGVATAEWPQDTSNQILQRADAALYRAKKEGRDRTVMSRAGEREEAPEPALQASSERPRNG